MTSQNVIHVHRDGTSAQSCSNSILMSLQLSALLVFVFVHFMLALASNTICL